jgi:hypothetical protein
LSRRIRTAVEDGRRRRGRWVSTDIELDIGRHGKRGHYQVRVVRSPAGGDQREEFDLDIDALLRGRPQLEASILSSAVGARRLMSAAERPVLEAGRHLFESVFTRSVYGAYRASLGVAEQQGERLRVVLRLSEPELAALPWEALYDPERQSYVCRQEPMVRRIPAQFNPRAPLQVTPPLQVLAMVASPRGLVPLDVQLERSNLEEALADLTAAGLVSITWVEPATWRSVHQHLLSGHWHVVHFIGHGDYDEIRDEGVLAFVGSDGRADSVEAGRFADLLGEADPTPRLVVLNACSSGESGANDMLSATAPALVHSGIEAVAAMQFAVSDDAAIAFAQGFYTAVAHARGVDEAARSGRIAMLGAAGSLEWLTPVLYLRGDSTHPIVIRPGGPRPVPEPTPPGVPIQRGRPPDDATVRGGPVEDAKQGEVSQGEVAASVDPAPPEPSDSRSLAGSGSIGSGSLGRADEPESSCADPEEPGDEALHPATATSRRWRAPSRRASVLGAAVLVLAGGVVIAWPRPARLPDSAVLVPVHDRKTGLVRLWTYDTDRAENPLPWAGSADGFAGGSTSSAVDRLNPTPSPDRTKVAYVQGAGRSLVVYVADSDGQNSQPLMTADDRPCKNTLRPAWSADGEQMAVVCITDGHPGSLWIVDADDGAGVRELVSAKPDRELGAPTWDSKGHRVFLWSAALADGNHVGHEGTPMSVDDSAKTPSDPKKVPGTEGAHYTEPDWGRRGLLMVQRSQDQASNTIVVVNEEGERPVDQGAYDDASWSPDGDHIVATLRQQGSSKGLATKELVMLDASDGTPKHTGVAEAFGVPSWSAR